jgi:hypothetical protein
VIIDNFKMMAEVKRLEVDLESDSVTGVVAVHPLGIVSGRSPQICVRFCLPGPLAENLRRLAPLGAAASYIREHIVDAIREYQEER